MLVTITQFRRLATDDNGSVLPLGEDRVDCTVRTTVGAFAALDASTRFIRVATDTAIQMDINGGATPSADELFMPGSEYIAMDGGETLTIAVA